MRTRIPGVLALALAAFLASDRCRGDLVLADYSPQRNDRYYEGPDRAFVAEGYDLSGVGRATTLDPVTDMNSGRRWATLISPHFALSATHATPLAGQTIKFVDGNSPDSLQFSAVVSDSETIGGSGNSDLRLIRFDTAVTGVNTYAIVENDEPALVGQPIFVYGQVNRVGTNTIDGQFGTVGGPGTGLNPTYSFTYDFDTSNGNPNEAMLNSGDSGAPSFVVGEDNSLALVGVHSFQYDAQPGFPLPGSGDTFVSHYLPQIQARIAALNAQFGYTDTVRVVRVRPVPEPGALAMLGIGGAAAIGLRRLTRRTRRG